MPELPEVQTIINDLNKKIKGDTVVGFWSDWGKAIKNKSVSVFTKEITGRKILGARRIGKNIFIDLSGGPARNASRSDAGGKTLYIHLKMTGHLLVKKKEVRSKKKAGERDYSSERVNQYIHHIWYLTDPNLRMKSKSTNATNKKFNKTLEFSDLRKFGKIVLDDTEKISNLKEIKSLGVDAMSKEFNFKKFREILFKKPNAKIGILLMDQNIISGIGNIYRSEILYESGILPERKVGELSSKEIKNIFVNIKKVLEKAIKYRGTSDSDYRDTDGAPGGFQKIMKVYNQEKRKCQKCGTIITRKTLGQRSVFVCLGCQK
ncbi:MAG: DNA-formamidopyrimidine glycosylase [Patescibacteria group bacterium]|nr:DNA-formamidopyrimidine glycosylase [Patescibacteria group bacterium]